MNIQSQIKRTLSEADNLETLRRILEANPKRQRYGLAELVRQHFKFFNEKGESRIQSCVAALDCLRRKGLIPYPSPNVVNFQECKHTNYPHILPENILLQSGIPEDLKDFSEIKLKRVDTQSDLETLNTILHNEHPQKTTIFGGHQVKYLIDSPWGIIGCIVFSCLFSRPRQREQNGVQNERLPEPQAVREPLLDFAAMVSSSSGFA